MPDKSRAQHLADACDHLRPAIDAFRAAMQLSQGTMKRQSLLIINDLHDILANAGTMQKPEPGESPEPY